MAAIIQNVSIEQHILIFQQLECKDLINIMTVCRVWKQTIENRCFLSGIKYDKESHNLIIDVPRDLVIDGNLSVPGALVIRASNIYSKPGSQLSAGTNASIVAKRIRHLGSITAIKCDIYSDYYTSRLPGVVRSTGGKSSNTSLIYCLSHRPDFWLSLTRDYDYDIRK